MLIIGLTGGIGSGKSTVAAMLRELSAPIVDADLLARQVVEPGTPGLAEIAARFGPDVLGADGRLDRKRLGTHVFADPTARARLNAIIHPRIAAASRAAMAEMHAAGHPVAVYEAALLVENKVHQGLDGLIVVAVPEATQIARLCQRDEIDVDAARARVSAQLPLADKVAVADWVIENGGSPAETRAQVERVWGEIRTRASRSEGAR